MFSDWLSLAPPLLPTWICISLGIVLLFIIFAFFDDKFGFGPDVSEKFEKKEMFSRVRILGFLLSFTFLGFGFLYGVAQVDEAQNNVKETLSQEYGISIEKLNSGEQTCTYRDMETKCMVEIKDAGTVFSHVRVGVPNDVVTKIPSSKLPKLEHK